MTTSFVSNQPTNSSSTPSSGGPVAIGNQIIAQTFSADASGTLEAVTISVTCTEGADTLRPRVSIFVVDDGKPTQLLGETRIDTRDVPWTSQVTFSPGVPLVVGGRYAIVVNYPDARTTDRFRWAGAASSGDPNRICLLGVSSRGRVQWLALTSVCSFQMHLSSTGQTDQGVAAPMQTLPSGMGTPVIGQTDGGAPKNV